MPVVSFATQHKATRRALGAGDSHLYSVFGLDGLLPPLRLSNSVMLFKLCMRMGED